MTVCVTPNFKIYITYLQILTAYRICIPNAAVVLWISWAPRQTIEKQKTFQLKDNH